MTIDYSLRGTENNRYALKDQERELIEGFRQLSDEAEEVISLIVRLLTGT